MRTIAEIERELADAEANHRRLWNRAEDADLRGSASYEWMYGAAEDNDRLIKRLERELADARSENNR